MFEWTLFSKDIGFIKNTFDKDVDPQRYYFLFVRPLTFCVEEKNWSQEKALLNPLTTISYAYKRENIRLFGFS